ncbi:MAG: S8 family serine peptidase [Fimbriimonadales bacterium]
MNRFLMGMALAMAFCVSAFGDVGRVVGSGPDVFGGYTSEHILVRFAVGRMPNSLIGPIGKTGVRSLDTLGARWNVTSIDPLMPEGYGNPDLAESLGLTRSFKFLVPKGTDVIAMCAAFSRNANVEFAEVDGIGGTAYVPNDPLIANCYGLNNTGQTGGTADADIDAYEAWDTWKGGDNITLAVVDSGVTTHVELVGKMVPGWNTNNNTSVTTDVLGHGTHVAGTAGAQGDNSIGIAGVSFGVKIMPMRVLSNGGSGTEAQCGAGIVWATDHGADICTMSLQFYTGSTTFRDMVDYAHGEGVLLIAATGNNQGNVVAFPARFANCYGVGATDHNDVRPSFSNYGPQNDVVAPGVDVYSTIQTTGYSLLSGTSMATPHTSGLASLIWSYDPGLTNDEVFDVIIATVDDKGAVGWDQFYGWGRINAQSALALASDPLIEFTSLTMNSGLIVSGAVGDLFDSDDVRVDVANNGSRANEGIIMTASGTAPAMTFNRMQILLESSVTRAGVLQRVYAFDFVAGAWVEVDSRPMTTIDGTAKINITNNPSRFVQAGTNTVSIRVAMNQGFTGSRGWAANVDQWRVALRND